MDRLIYNLDIFKYNIVSFIDYHFGAFFVITLCFIIAYMFRNLFSNFIINLLHKIINKTKFSTEKSSLKFLARPLKLLMVSTVVYVAFSAQKELILKLPMLFAFITKTYRLLIIFCIINFFYNTVPLLLIIFEAKKAKEPDSTALDSTIVMFLVTLIKSMIAILGILIFFSEFNININGLITGVGLGGVTFALAAKDTASNIFGGFVIISDKPFSVGDWIQTPNLEGIVENITFRSTRIRTFDDALVVVPNSSLSTSYITNWSKMNKRKIKFNVGLNYNTSEDNIRKIIKAIETYLISHENVISDSVLVRFDEFADSSLDIMVMFFVDQTSLVELKRIKEEVNFKIMSIVRNNNAEFAFPSTSVYIENSK